MSVSQLPTLQPRRQPAPAVQSVTITSQVIYMKGPWGTERPLRNFGNVVAFARHRHTSLGKLVTIERIGETILDGNGEFTLSFRLDSDDIFLEISENFTDTTFEFQLIDPKNPAMSRVDPNRVGKQFVGNDRRRIRVPWGPPRRELATVNSRAIVDTQSFAHSLEKLLKNPTYPVTVTLISESASTFPDSRDYTRACHLLFFKLVQGNLPSDFPARCAKELAAVPQFTSLLGKRPPLESISWVLERFVTMNINYLESTSVLGGIVTALYRALDLLTGNSNEPIGDATIDAAAVCTLLFIAGLMARDGAKATVSFGTLTFPEMQMRIFNGIFVSVTR